jgi:hypothetical protein
MFTQQTSTMKLMLAYFQKQPTSTMQLMLAYLKQQTSTMRLILAYFQTAHQHDEVDAGCSIPLLISHTPVASMNTVPATGSREERERTIQLAEMTAAGMGAAVRNDAVISAEPNHRPAAKGLQMRCCMKRHPASCMQATAAVSVTSIYPFAHGTAGTHI